MGAGGTVGRPGGLGRLASTADALAGGLARLARTAQALAGGVTSRHPGMAVMSVVSLVSNVSDVSEFPSVLSPSRPSPLVARPSASVTPVLLSAPRKAGHGPFTGRRHYLMNVPTFSRNAWFDGYLASCWTS